MLFRSIALGILAASGQVAPESLDGHEFAGELSLTGDLRPVRGALAMALQARTNGRAFVLPEQNAPQAALAQGDFEGADKAIRLALEDRADSTETLAVRLLQARLIEAQGDKDRAVRIYQAVATAPRNSTSLGSR